METQVQAKPLTAEVKRTILVVEDEKDIRDLVRYNLEAEGFAVVEANDGEVGLNLAVTERPALIVLDLMLPRLSGLVVCRLLRTREETRQVPILILTARASEVDKILGLETGADDYVTKPFSPRELVARVKAVLRRAYSPVLDRPHEVYEKGRLRIDYDTYEVTLDGHLIGLSLREFDIRRLRQRIERDDANPVLILTIRGVGYKFNADALEE